MDQNGIKTVLSRTLKKKTRMIRFMNAERQKTSYVVQKGEIMWVMAIYLLASGFNSLIAVLLMLKNKK